MELKKYEDTEEIKKDGQNLMEFTNHILNKEVIRDFEALMDDLHIQFIIENVSDLETLKDYNLVKKVFDFLKRS